MEICENKKVVCRYPLLETVVQENALFGWALSNKILLNRFGNPVPYGVTYDEGDLNEKCSYELHFIRVIDSKKIPVLNELHDKFNSIEFKPTKFSKGRISGLVWLSILFTALISSSKTHPICIILSLLTIGGWVAVLLTGIKSVARAKKENEVNLLQKQEIVLQAEKILEATEI